MSVTTKKNPIILAAIQMVSGVDLEENINTATRLIEEAVNQGAKLVLLPEYWPLMGHTEFDKLTIAEHFGKGTIQNMMSRVAKQTGVCLIGGTLPLFSSEGNKVFNTTLVYNADGQCLARYDKIHLFNFSAHNESYDEFRTLVPGEKVVTFESFLGKIGLSICYDLRFPELYRAMGDCSLMVVPSAFTYTTGKAHWEVLLRARAIENQCYILAAGQGGVHANGRKTYGHSMLVNPWGGVESVLPEGEGVVLGNFDPNYLIQVREMLPALRHRHISC